MSYKDLEAMVYFLDGDTDFFNIVTRVLEKGTFYS